MNSHGPTQTTRMPGDRKSWPRVVLRVWERNASTMDHQVGKDQNEEHSLKTRGEPGQSGEHLLGSTDEPRAQPVVGKQKDQVAQWTCGQGHERRRQALTAVHTLARSVAQTKSTSLGRTQPRAQRTILKDRLRGPGGARSDCPALLCPFHSIWS